MKRPKNKDPPKNWFKNKFDDKEWGHPTKPSTGGWFRHWHIPYDETMWYKKHKYTFWRIGVDSEELNELHV